LLVCTRLSMVRSWNTCMSTSHIRSIPGAFPPSSAFDFVSFDTEKITPNS
jgi:hypothetical protein